MSGLRPVSLYGLEVPPGDEPVPAFGPDEYPGTFKLTMAALDPFQKPIINDTTTTEASFVGATLRIIRIPDDDSDDEDDDEEDVNMADILDGFSSEDDDEDVNGGPSDPKKSNKAKRMALLKEALAQNGDMDVDSPKLSAKQKGKAKAVEEEDDLEDDEDDEDEDDFDGPEEFILCTLDPAKNYQQTLDITISEHETVYFQVSGTHSIYLTGNILIPDQGDMYDSEEEDDEDDDDEYDLTPDDDELEMPDSEDESDELDDMEDPRVLELEDEVEVPKLIKAETEVKKGKNKRSAPDSADNSIVDDKATTLDDLVAKSLKPADEVALNGEKLSKKQKKKLKANGGNAVDAPATTEDVGVKAEDTTKPSPAKADKKVQFSKTLIQGPTPSGTSSDTSKVKTAEASKGTEEKPAAKGGLGVKVVQGVTIDDKKLGSGPAAKKGDKVSMRYIGKLDDTKKVFDSNKKGKPFTFQLGAGQVIKGWEIGILGMTVGGERRMTIPPHHAYGSKSMPDIPANSTLVFDVKLLEIK